MPKPQYGRQRPSQARPKPFTEKQLGVWVLNEPVSLGFLPDIVMASDPRPAKEQIEDRYRHGGGWRPITGFKLNPDTMVLRFPGDPPFHPSAAMPLSKTEFLVFYRNCSLLAVINVDQSFEVTRVD